MKKNIFNFSAGPAMMPIEVMQQAQAAFLNWHDLGVSVSEISHRSQPFIDLAKQSEKDLRELLSIPDHYHILFLPGGARTQFSAIPMNLKDDFKSAAYVQTGHWGKSAEQEASRYLTTKVIANSESTEYTTVPAQNTWDDFSDCAYLHYTDNETIHGVEFDFIPDVKNVPLICDMSSNLLSRPFDVSKFGLIYACSQKNIAITGITIVVIRDDLLKRKPHSALPSMMNYALQMKHESMFNTPPTFEWYFASLVFQWLKKQGGLKALAQKNAEKSAKLYAYLDSQDFYQNRVEKKYRSRMNVVFHLPTPELDAAFVKAALQHHLFGLKGHTVLGGVRASIYNAMPMEGVDALISFMRHFVSHQS
ncbi:MAG: 3-phosphoserine/phosphohydroxythreonine transaminase [Gammaproteobacteria bacterium CG_4_10_14_0_8_um_filter_38_16]|nr:MAG: 3-phosphoserine/phosphohydroxythreonine transaminase [Gammaproteobacteria bacterium CG_4_10_14_0_8_um_filter_38_16]PJA04200.1 MAG: 3-phosphoserine/phosphohydroxythreonine transaminase [Gammaproteobacteria bacterium CG_4_10_14_0_2_um_filter_38_22]PJB11036.1 MAG: 3-phosphoserine/phosphohydroxythreonine transaminase [Gammaproteobacteria bacterium CG_4_9_14_3_um_filter_38_9]